MPHNNQRHFPLLMLIVTSSVMWCGCRSMPGRNLFSRNSQPSADVLAGTGPTTTYPAPPSLSATPQAIASVAGGTSSPANSSLGGFSNSIASTASKASPTAQASAMGNRPGYATPASNYAAANANGFQTQGLSGAHTNPKYGMPEPQKTPHSISGAGNQSLAGVGSTTKASPYTFGSKAFSPKSQPETTPALPTSVAAAASPAGYGSSAYNLPSNSSALTKSPSATASPIAGQSIAKSSLNSFGAKSSGGGFTLPDALAGPSPSASAKKSGMGFGTATAAIKPPSVPPNASLPQFQRKDGAGFALPPIPTRVNNAVATVGATAPDFSTAAASAPNAALATPAITPTHGGSAFGASSHYMPGSTRGASSYPSSPSAPATSGSFYR